MSYGLDVIIIDDDPDVCILILKMIEKFYTWGEVHAFTDPAKATEYCLNQTSNIAIFVIDVFLQETNGFNFLDAIADKYPGANEDTIIITGSASDDVVNMCTAANINHLIEKPIRQHSLQFAIRSIVTKYIYFARRLLTNPVYTEAVIQTHIQ
jgi:response regulator of citrate/malate metabolism